MNLRKRPRDPAQLAKLMIDIATGDVEAASVGTLVNVFSSDSLQMARGKSR